MNHKPRITILGLTKDESSYVIGSFRSDSLSASNDITASLHDIKHQLFMQRPNLIIEPNHQKSPTIKSVLMTRRELTDPFGSDEDDDDSEKNRNKSPLKELISPPAIDNVNIESSAVNAPTIFFNCFRKL